MSSQDLCAQNRKIVFHGIWNPRACRSLTLHPCGISNSLHGGYGYFLKPCIVSKLHPWMSCTSKLKVQNRKLTHRKPKLKSVKVFPFTINLNFSTFCMVHRVIIIKCKMLIWLGKKTIETKLILITKHGESTFYQI